MPVDPAEWLVESLYGGEKDFKLTHIPCGAVLTVGADTPENAQTMISNNQNGHVCSV